MGNRRRHWLPVALLMLVSVGVLGQPDSTLERFVQRRKSLTQTSEQGLGRRLSMMLKESMHDSSSSALLPTRLMEDYFVPMDTKSENASLLVSVSTHKHDDQHSHQARRLLRLRHKRKWSDPGKGKGGKSGHLAKSARDHKIVYHGKETSKSREVGKGPSKSSKYHAKTKGKGKGHAVGPFYKPKAKSHSKKSSKGKGSKKSKASTKKRTTAISEKDLDLSCSGLDFRSSGNQGNGSGAQGKGKRRELKSIERSLQFGGELCKLNVFNVMRSHPDLSIFVELIEAAELEDIFLCAGKAKRTFTFLCFFDEP